MSPHTPSEEEVLSYFDALSNWGRWGDDDQLGTLNLITPAKRIAAAEHVRVGTTVSLRVGHRRIAAGRPAVRPPQRFMLATGQGLADEHRVVAPDRAGHRSAGALEHIGLVYHGHTVTHIDGLSHIFWDGKMYNGKPAELVTSTFGATHHAITALKDGIVTRGVLLDVATYTWRRLARARRGRLPRGPRSVPKRTAACASSEGDVLVLRTGYGKKVREQGPDDVARGGAPAGTPRVCRGCASAASPRSRATPRRTRIPSGYPSSPRSDPRDRHRRDGSVAHRQLRPRDARRRRARARALRVPLHARAAAVGGRDREPGEPARDLLGPSAHHGQTTGNWNVESILSNSSLECSLPPETKSMM